jgi:sugar lactone lactonase YvrE
MTGNHFFVSFEEDSLVLDHFSGGRPDYTVEFTGLIRPTILGKGSRVVAVLDEIDPLTVRVYSAGGGDPLLEFSDPDWVSVGGLAVDEDGNVYVSDTQRNFVRAYDRLGKQRFGVDLADSGFGIGHVLSPRGLCFDGEALLIAEADPEKAQVQRISVDEPQRGLLFSPTIPFISSFTDSAGDEIALGRPISVCTDNQGFIFVLDDSLGRIFRYNPTGTSSAIVNGPGNLGPDTLQAATSIGTYENRGLDESRVYALENGSGNIHYWYSIIAEPESIPEPSYRGTGRPRSRAGQAGLGELPKDD